MLIIPKSVHESNRLEAKKGMENHFNKQMEDIINANKSVDLYWILGKVRMEKIEGKKIARPFLQACLEKPSLVKESFVYEVDNRRGVKTLLWVMHPDNTLSFPTLGKSIRVADDKGGIITTTV